MAKDLSEEAGNQPTLTLIDAKSQVGVLSAGSFWLWHAAPWLVLWMNIIDSASQIPSMYFDMSAWVRDQCLATNHGSVLVYQIMLSPCSSWVGCFTFRWTWSLLARNTELGFDYYCYGRSYVSLFLQDGYLLLSFSFVCTVLADWGPRRWLSIVHSEACPQKKNCTA